MPQGALISDPLRLCPTLQFDRLGVRTDPKSKAGGGAYKEVRVQGAHAKTQHVHVDKQERQTHLEKCGGGMCIGCSCLKKDSSSSSRILADGVRTLTCIGEERLGATLGDVHRDDRKEKRK